MAPHMLQDTCDTFSWGLSDTETQPEAEVRKRKRQKKCFFEASPTEHDRSA